MALKITVPNSSSENLTFGSAQTPVAAEVVGIDSGSSNGQLAFKTTASGASTERMRIDASGNVIIGATSPLAPLTVYNSSNPYMALGNTLYTTYFNQTSTDFHLYTNAAYPLRFGTNNTERMRIDSSGNVLVNNSVSTRGKFSILGTESTSNASISTMPTVDGYVVLSCRNAAGTQSGYIYTNASTTAYNTSSDYRLKENIQPMVGALDTVAQLKPVTYNWIADGSKGQGFIAHELQAVVPDCVTGEKDAVDADGNPIYQGIDTSFLVATLTAAIKELKAELDTVKSELSALKGAA